MTIRNFKDHTCKADGCNNMAEKDKYGLYKTYCSDTCNPRKRTRNCMIDGCNNIPVKTIYGVYSLYCSEECMKKGRQIKFNTTYAEKDVDAITDKRRDTCKKRYGVDNVSKTSEVKNKLKKSTKRTAKARLIATKANNLTKYGVESTNSLQSVKDLKKSNYKEKTGYDHQLKDPEIAASVSKKNTDNATMRLEKAKETNKERYGFENPSSNEAVKKKRTNTMVERFGVENASQNAEVHSKKMNTSYKKKEFIFPSGRIAMMQGYEPYALRELLKIYHEDDIITDVLCIPRIKYIGNDNKVHYYFPDIYIPKKNLIIEVKSLYTYSSRTAWFKTNLAKQKYTLATGYDFMFMVMDNGKFNIIR